MIWGKSCKTWEVEALEGKLKKQEEDEVEKVRVAAEQVVADLKDSEKFFGYAS